jgi:hypothetical protein
MCLEYVVIVQLHASRARLLRTKMHTDLYTSGVTIRTTNNTAAVAVLLIMPTDHCSSDHCKVLLQP